jgi:hypothetical protein
MSLSTIVLAGHPIESSAREGISVGFFPPGHRATQGDRVKTTNRLSLIPVPQDREPKP